ncbi:MAG TPA: TIGR03013 family XrtA/PEP-CTERM system glycosyltransferase, partial [Pseudolabrys sp.]|nr:TIGR03013 family XrtA/PEP-CTERM system glycosyltransferase [Pseudolabrys sp.]
SMHVGVSLRFFTTNPGAIHSVGFLAPKAVIFAVVILGVMTAFGLYQRNSGEEGPWGGFIRVTASFFVGLIVMILIFYAFPDLYLGRGAFTLAFLYAYVAILTARLLFMQFADHTALRRRVLLVGSGSRAAKVQTLEKDATGKVQFNLVGCLPLSNEHCDYNKARILPDQGSILSVARKYKVDEIIVGVRERRNGGMPTSQLLECKLAGIEIIDLPSFFERQMGHIQLESLNPSWMIFSDGFQRSSLKDITKRAFDIVIGSLLLLLTMPVFLLTALLVWLESGSPILYRQERVGAHGRSFDVLKFRSMRQDAERDGVPRWAKKQDARVTRVGKVIRMLRIDELPQIFNVLKGDMSFVGPRPERPYFVDELAKKITYYPLRHTVKPGITGWAQIRYSYGATVEDAIEKLQYDLYYVKNHTLFLDLIILLQTAQVVLFGKGAR